VKILLSAYACAPLVGSESGIGWGVALELAKRHTVWVLTRTNNRPAHERAFDKEPKPSGLHFIYYDLPRWASFWKQGARHWRLYYWLWQLGSARIAHRLIQREQIDLCQHVTIGMDYMPSGLALVHAPFLWGPVGSENIHPRLHRDLPAGDRMRERLRVLLRFLARTFDPFVCLTRARADMILSFTSADSRTRSTYLRAGRKIVPVVQTGLEPEPTVEAPLANTARPFTVIFAGRLVHWKGAQLAAEAFALFGASVRDARFVVVGEGPLHDTMERTLRAAGLEERVEFTGTIPPATLMQRLRAADVFLYPAYRHGLATICLQAMASGLPVVCLRDGPIGEAVGTDCGIAVPVTEADLPAALAAGLASLHGDLDLRHRQARNAMTRVRRDYSYEAVVGRWKPVYDALFPKHAGAGA
jgi:glycosyltransferase involved in cell wall biosynthesis